MDRSRVLCVGGRSVDPNGRVMGPALVLAGQAANGAAAWGLFTDYRERMASGAVRAI
jgi:hypothetical protein